MKRILFTFVCFFVFLNLFGQHISFVGIQLGQSEKVVDRMLLQKGFRYVGINNVMGTKMYDGTFWRFQDTRINTEVENGKVTAITMSPSLDLYNNISDFNNLVQNLDQKYGKHRLISDYFKVYKYAYIEDENGFYWKVRGGFIIAYYVTNSITGKIMIGIDYLDNSNECVILNKGQRRNTNNDL